MRRRGRIYIWTAAAPVCILGNIGQEIVGLIVGVYAILRSGIDLQFWQVVVLAERDGIVEGLIACCFDHRGVDDRVAPGIGRQARQPIRAADNSIECQGTARVDRQSVILP